VDVDAVLFWKVLDPRKAALDVADYQSAISWASQTAMLYENLKQNSTTFSRLGHTLRWKRRRSRIRENPGRIFKEIKKLVIQKVPFLKNECP
jgi:hypothetical protein